MGQRPSAYRPCDPSRWARAHPAATFAALHAVACFALLSPAFLGDGLLLPGRLLSSAYPWGAYRAGAEVGEQRLGDLLLCFYPWFRFWGTAVGSGTWPLFNPYSGIGLPFAANPQTASYHPLTALSLLGPWAWNLVLYVRLLVSGIAAFSWLRSLGRSRHGATLGGFAYAFSFPIVGWAGFPHGNVNALLPLLALTARGVAVEGTWRRAAQLGSVLFLMHVGGHPESTFMNAGAAVIVWAQAATAGGRRDRLRSLGLLAAGGVLGTLAASVQILPFLEYLSRSRVLLENEHPTVHLPYRALLTWVFPHSMGRLLDDGFAAVPTLSLAAFGILRGRRRRFAGILLAGGLAAGLAYGVPPFLLLSKLPPLDRTLTHRSLYIVALALATAAAFGWDRLAALRRRHGGRRALGEGALTAATLFGAALAAALAARVPAPALGLAAVLLAAPFALCALLRSPSLRLAAFAPVLLLDLGRAAFDFQVVAPRQDVLIDTGLTDFLRRRPGSGRVLPVEGLLPPNLNLPYAIPSLLSYDAIDDLAQAAFLRRLGGYAGKGLYSFVEPRRLSNPRVAELVALEFVVGDPQGTRLDTEEFRRRTGFDLELAYDEPDGRAYRLRTYRGRAWWAEKARGDPDFAAFYSLLERRDPDASAALFVEGASQSGTGRAGDVRLTAFRPGWIEVSITSAGTGWVVFSEVYSKDWKASVNGARVETTRANGGILIAVPVPAGRSTVTLRYLPASFVAGAVLSVGALGALAALGARRHPRGRRQTASTDLPSR